MRITKLGHSCVLVEEGGVTFLIDPGKWSDGVGEISKVDAILISHSHSDHCDPEGVARLFSLNPNVKIITNSQVREILLKEGIADSSFLRDTSLDVRGLKIETFENDHRSIHPRDLKEVVTNTSFLVGEKLFHPGDTLFNPHRKVEVFAMPVSGGWLKVGEAIDLAIEMSPKVCFPIHDAPIVPGRYGGMHGAPKRILPEFGIEFVGLETGKVVEIE